MRPKSAFSAFRTLMPSANYLLSDLVRCDSALQIVLAFRPSSIVSRGLSHPTQKV
jgi:hypothetical protein